MGIYIDQDYIEGILGLEFNSDTTPNETQISTYINLGEAKFEDEVGVFTEQNITEVVKCLHNGLLTTYTPINTITSIYKSDGTWDRNFSDNEVESDEYRIDDANRGKILLEQPYVGVEYEITYNAGYSSEDIPDKLKNLVFLYVMREIFKNTLFSTNGNVSNYTETIDVEVYKQVTGGNPYEGIKVIDNLIAEEKRFFKGRLKTYLGI